jgi:CubicO group peptidase (beta-lactamase class C family)
MALACNPANAELPNLEPFVDGVVGAYMSQDHIAGVQVAVVRDGETLLVKGYGIDSVDPRRVVDPQQSLFRIGSISKTFTWLAIMQLVERGELKLDDPVNKHLPDALDVPDGGFEQPIRIVDLMNHTAGFEDIVQGLFVAADATPLSLHEQLRTRRPQRVREPGKIMAYSNYSTALAGAIVAEVSGMEYETYVEQNILTPLGLTHTTFRERLDAMAQNIEMRDGAWQAIPHEHIVSMAPAGSAVSTAADMARYMLALLDPARLEAAGVLRTETFARMREPSFQSAPGMPAIHHGFFNAPLGVTMPLGLDNLSHSGATLHFRSFLVVTSDLADRAGVEQGTLGVYIAANSATAMNLVQTLPERIIARYFPPASQVTPTEADGNASRVQQYAGQYRTARRSYTQFEKIINVSAVNVTATRDGQLVMNLGGRTLRFVEIGEDLFRQSDGDTMIAFVRDERGRISRFVVNSLGTLERIGFFASMAWLSLMLGAAMITSVGILIAASLHKQPVPPYSVGERRSAQVMVGTAAAWLTFIALAVAWMLPFTSPAGQDDFVYGYPHPLLKIALAAGVVATGLSVLGLATLLPVWRERTWPLGRRLRHTAAVVLFVALVGTLLQWNAIGFRYL